MDQLGRILERAARVVLLLLQVIVVAILIGSVGLIVTNAFGRYFMDAPIRWQEEILRYALLWLVFLGAILVTFDNKHLRMDLIANALKGPARIVVNGLAVLAFLFVCGFIAWHSMDWVNLFLETGQVSQIAEVPMVIPHVIIPLSLALMVVAILVRLGGHVRGDLESELDEMHTAEELAAQVQEQEDSATPPPAGRGEQP